jgi:L-cysteine/cystine lyase
VLPVDVCALGADYYAVSGHKWWCGPEGVAGLYVAAAARDELRTTFTGWRGGARDGAAKDGAAMGARRFEVATSAYPLYPGLRAALKVHRDWGPPEARYRRVRTLTDALWRRLQEAPRRHGWPIVASPQDPGPEAGIVCLLLAPDSHPAASSESDAADRLVRHLEGCAVLARTVGMPGRVRLCVHYLTCDEEIERLWDGVESFFKSAS